MGKINPAAANLDDSASVSSTIKRSQREYIIDELVKTERTYVQHLELLQEFKKLVEEKGVISGDQIHDIFLNLNALLDFQRRFLIRVEQTNALPPSEQNWGNLFVLYKDAFKVYEPYIANQKRCEQIAMREFDKLKETGGTPEMRQMVESPTLLTSFLLKPFQRLTKYPLLLSVSFPAWSHSISPLTFTATAKERRSRRPKERRSRPRYRRSLFCSCRYKRCYCP